MGKVISQAALLATVKGLGFKGKTLPDLKKWMDSDDGYETMLVGGEELDVEKSWKTVTVSWDPEDDVAMNPPAEPEGAALDPNDPDPDDDPMPKSGRRAAMVAAQRSAVQAAKGRNGLGVNPEFASAFVGTLPQSQGGSAAIHGSDSFSAKRKAYTHAAKNGMPYRGAKCVYADGDRAELAGAIIRLQAFGRDTGPVGDAYATQKRLDREIVGKTGLVGSPNSYGAFVFEEHLPELIELFPTFGAARQVATVTSMSRDTLKVNKWLSDVTMYDEGEADEITASDGSATNVSLVATKTTALVKNSAEILNDSAIDISGVVSRSIARAMAKWEDESYFNGSHNRDGLLTKIDASSTYDAALSTGWGDYTVSLLQNWKAKLAGWALAQANLAIVCHPAFYEAVLKVRAYSAGGTPGESLLNGIKIRAWDGVPVVFSHVMPSTYSADQISAYIGAFDMATKFGVVRGSEQIATSDQRYFEFDIVAMRYTQRWAMNCHEVSGTNTGVVALKD